MLNSSEGRQLFGAEIKHFIIAGDAIFALKNTLNGHHLTYRVTLCEDKPDFWFVSTLTGPDNTSNYTPLGTLREDHYMSGLIFKRNAKSSIGEQATPAVTARWFFDKLNKKALPSTLEVWHKGKCGKCARLLTTPESIEAGLGPICRKGM